MTLFTDEQAHPIALLRLLSAHYGVEWMAWAPAVLRQTVSKDFNVDMARINVAKALAAAAVATRDEFWHVWETFHFLCQALNNNFPSALDLQELTVAQMMNAAAIARAIRHELKELAPEPAYSEEVARFVAASALHQGVWYLPDPLGFAEPYATKRWYRCKDCGNEAEVLFPDGLCDVCVERLNTDSLRAWKPNPDLLAKGRGKNIEFFEKNPSAAVARRLERVEKSPGTVLQETPTDICVARLLVAKGYVRHREAQLAKQAA